MNRTVSYGKSRLAGPLAFAAVTLVYFSAWGPAPSPADSCCPEDAAKAAQTAGSAPTGALADDHVDPEHGEEHAESPADDPPAGHDRASHAETNGASAPEACELEQHGDEAGALAHELVVSEETLQLYRFATTRVEKRSPEQRIQAPARVTYNEEAMAYVSTPLEGRIVEAAVRVGDTVLRGDVLFRVHSPSLGEMQNALLQRRAELDAARIPNEVALAELDRARKLVSGNGISQAEFLRREAEYKKTKGLLLAAEAAVRAAENQLIIFGFSAEELNARVESGAVDPVYAVCAPIDGQVVERNVTLGKVVAPGDQALLVLADLSTWWVIASVPEHNIGGIRPGWPVRVELDAAGHIPLDGTVSYIAPVVDEVTRAAQVRIEVKDGDVPLRAGMFGRVDFAVSPAGPSENALVVPRKAVWSIDGHDYVFQPQKDEPTAFHVKPVSISGTFGEHVSIASGLEEGETVVAEGGFILKADLNKSRAKACCPE